MLVSDETKVKLRKALNVMAALASVVALFTLVVSFGYELTRTQAALFERLDLLVLLYFLLQYPVRALISSDIRHYLRHHWFQGVVALALLLHLTLVFRKLARYGVDLYFLETQVVGLTKMTVVVSQILVVLTLVSGALHLNRKIAALKFHPAQTLLLSFLGLILFGALCMTMPRCLEPGQALSFLDALFTATSAACVTGLAVVDTGTFFSQRGQVVILLLIQFGGLGIMTIASYLVLFFAGGVGIKERVMLLDMLSLENMKQITRMLERIVSWTLAIELIGALLLFLLWHDHGMNMGDRAFSALFHSVSAFCNAGFSLFSDSLMGEVQRPMVLLVFTLLIVFGGLGFGTLTELGGHFRQRQGYKRRLSVQTKLVLITTGLLLGVGALLLVLVQPLEGHLGTRLMNAFFSSVTARTAGFNTVDFGAFNLAGSWIMMVLMFVGASPGSTGGGLKTSTLAILFLRMRATLQGQDRIMIFFRAVPRVVSGRALVIFAFSISMLAVIVFLLLVTEQAPLEDILFEAISAFSTTGLSRGLTGHLSDAGKCIIIVAMFIGRLGPLTIAFAITPPHETYRIDYPSENVVVG